MESQSNATLKELNKWFGNNELYLNYKKTKFVFFHIIQITMQLDFRIFSQNNEIDKK